MAGTNFIGATAVFFGGIAAASFTVNSAMSSTGGQWYRPPVPAVAPTSPSAGRPMPTDHKACDDLVKHAGQQRGWQHGTVQRTLKYSCSSSTG